VYSLSTRLGVRSARQARAGEAREGWRERWPLTSWSDRDVESLNWNGEELVVSMSSDV
jgi:hypothetical protein